MIHSPKASNDVKRRKLHFQDLKHRFEVLFLKCGYKGHRDIPDDVFVSSRESTSSRTNNVTPRGAELRGDRVAAEVQLLQRRLGTQRRRDPWLLRRFVRRIPAGL